MRLIATDHFDPDGEERLRQVLVRLQPRKISIEAPANLTLEHLLRGYEDAYRQAVEVALTLEPACVREFFPQYVHAYGGELRAVRRHIAEYPAQVLLIDDPQPEMESDMLGEGIFKGMTLRFVEFVGALLDTAGTETDSLTQATAEDLASVAKATFGRDAYEHARTAPQLATANGRDRRMAARMREERPDVHIGGLRHAYYRGPPPLLHELLPDLITERIPLDWAAEYRSDDPRFRYVAHNGDGHKP